MRVLVIEDEAALATAVLDLLKQNGIEGDIAATEYQGLDLAMTGAYDCLLVDVMLPDGDGIEIVRELRQLGFRTPILVLTARNDTTDKVVGLNAGADDYLGKPFDPNELIARVHALVRRSSGHVEIEVLEHGGLKLFRASRTLEINRHVLELSSKEYMLLECLFLHPTQVLTRDQLIAHVWGPDADVAENALDTYIYFLRKKCADAGVKHLIKTVRGEGYCLHSAR